MTRHQMAYTLMNEAQAVADLNEYLRSIGVECPELVDLSIESETNFKEVMGHLIKQEGELSAQIDGLKEYIATLQARKQRMEMTRESIRSAMARSLKLAECKTLSTAYGTISLRAKGAKVNVVKEFEIPERFFEQRLNTSALNKAALEWLTKKRELEAIDDEDERNFRLNEFLEENPPIPGIEFEEGEMTVSIRRKPAKVNGEAENDEK
jgi:Siphovirus Gp157.